MSPNKKKENRVVLSTRVLFKSYLFLNLFPHHTKELRTGYGMMGSTSTT